MRTTFLYLAVLFLVPHVDAAPAPAEGRAAKEKLEALKKRLPDLLSDWQKSEKDDWLPNQWTCKAELRLLRRVGPDRAKAVILFAPFDEKGASVRNHDLLLTIFLSYQDSCWTIERSEMAGRLTDSPRRLNARPSLS